MKDLVFIQNEQPITTSLKVAEKFEKNHQHVMRDIRDLEKLIADCMKENNICVFGNEEVIKENEKIFGSIKPAI